MIDHVEGKRDNYEVVFLATADGKIRKMVTLVNRSSACLIEEIKIVPNGEPKPVKAMKISHERVSRVIQGWTDGQMDGGREGWMDGWM